MRAKLTAKKDDSSNSGMWVIWKNAPIILAGLLFLAYGLSISFDDSSNIQGAAIGPLQEGKIAGMNMWTSLLMLGVVYLIWITSMFATMIGKRP